MPIESDFTAPAFSIRAAYYLANACQAAYLDDLGDWAGELALGPRAATFAIGAFRGFVADMDAATLVAFRGTDSIDTWLADGRVVQVEDPAYPGKVHRGFAAAMGDIWPDLAARLPAAAAGRPVWVTGHSLGAALANLAAVRLASAGYAVRGVYTFGSPRVGDPGFYQGYTPPTYRFVNNNDVVPHVPLELMALARPDLGHRLALFTYKHVGTLKYMDRHGQLGEGMSGWAAKKDFIINALLRSGGSPEPQAVADHHIQNYVAAIKSNL